MKFNEKLSDAIDINVLGTKKILDLAMQMKQLKVSNIFLYGEWSGKRARIIIKGSAVK